MNKQHFITVSILISALAFQPMVAEEIYLNQNLQITRNTVSSDIAYVLHNRGLDEDVAKKLSDNLVDDDPQFTMMIDNLLHGYKDVNKDEIIDYLSNAALYRQNVHLDKYDDILHMITTIKQRILDKEALAKLSMIAKQNASLHV